MMTIVLRLGTDAVGTYWKGRISNMIVTGGCARVLALGPHVAWAFALELRLI